MCPWFFGHYEKQEPYGVAQKTRNVKWYEFMQIKSLRLFISSDGDPLNQKPVLAFTIRGQGIRGRLHYNFKEGSSLDRRKKREKKEVLHGTE